MKVVFWRVGLRSKWRVSFIIRISGCFCYEWLLEVLLAPVVMLFGLEFGVSVVRLGLLDYNLLEGR